MGNKNDKIPVDFEIEEEEWEKEDAESSPEIMTIIPHTWEELTEEMKKKIDKSGISEEEGKANINILYSVLYFNARKEFENFPVATKQGKCAQCSKQCRQEAKKLVQIPTKAVIKGHMEFLDKGGFGAVFSGKLQLDPNSKKREKYAIKKLPHHEKFDRLSNYSEIFYMSHLNHPNICNFKGAYFIPGDSHTTEQKNEVWMIMEYLQGGTLNEASKIVKLSEKHVAFVAREMLKALKFIHEQGFAHRDLKSQNVMLSIEGQVKLIDFGLMCDFRKGPRTRMLGSPYWIPPEMIKSEPHSFEVDVWSMAVCLLELIIQKPPLYGNTISSMFTVATKGLVHAIPETSSKNCKDFLSRCLVVNPSERGIPNELLNHKWVTQEKLEEGIVEVLRSVFLSNAIAQLSSM